MAQSYTGWSIEKLKKEQAKIEKALSIAEKRDKKAAMAKLSTVAKQHGFELDELMTGSKSTKKAAAPKGRATSKKKKSKARGKVAPKYRNPDDESQTWTGRGRKPLWVVAQLDSGANIEDFAI